MADSKIEMKIDEEIKPLKELCEKLVKMATSELEQNPQNVDAKEMGEVIDMIKDLSEAKKYMAETCYKKYILKTMEEHEDEYGETWDEDGAWDESGKRYYRGQPRSKTSGRYISRDDGRRKMYDGNGNGSMTTSADVGGNTMNYTEKMPMDYRMDMDTYRNNSPRVLRDMDRATGRMYYSDLANRVLTQNEIPMNQSRYDRAKRNYTENKQMNPQDGAKSMESLEEYMKSLSEDVTDMVKEMSPNEKQMLKQKMQVLMQKI